MNESTTQAPTNQTPATDDAEHQHSTGRGHMASLKLSLIVLCCMLVLALIGMGLTQASESGAWEYWLFVVFVYAGLGIWRGSRHAKQTGQSVSKAIVLEVFHWVMLVGFLAVLRFLESREIVNRASASYFALMLLAISCCMAGVHIDRLLLVVGVVLTIMLVAMATLEQLTLVLWLFMVVVAVLAAGFFYFQAKRQSRKATVEE